MPASRYGETITQEQVKGPWRAATRTFTHRVVLRPARMGTLAVLGSMVALVVVGGAGWWIGLGVVLFQLAASALVAAWMRTEPAVSRPQVRHRWATTRSAPDRVPRQRRPGPDE
ncbi:MAG TPA: hypothetical protein VIY28_18750 [Pseudonocardiaceae bacterium]